MPAKHAAGSPLLAAVAVGAAHRLPCASRLCRFARKFVPGYRDRASSARKRAAGTGCDARRPRCQSQAARLALCRPVVPSRRTRAISAMSERHRLVGARPHLRRRAAQRLRAARVLRAPQALDWRNLFERNERSECSEFCAGPEARAAQGSLSAKREGRRIWGGVPASLWRCANCLAVRWLYVTTVCSMGDLALSLCGLHYRLGNI